MATELHQLTRAPVAKVEMLIRRPVDEVFEAFVDPAITSRFWFTKGSGRLETGREVRWDWEMYGFSVDVRVRTVEKNRRIVVDWSAYGPSSTIEWTFRAVDADSTAVGIVNSGFGGDADQAVASAIDSCGGFAFVLAGAKAYLEHGVELNLVADRHVLMEEPAAGPAPQEPGAQASKAM